MVQEQYFSNVRRSVSSHIGYSDVENQLNVPHESILGEFLLILYINDMPDIRENSCLQTTHYCLRMGMTSVNQTH